MSISIQSGGDKSCSNPEKLKIADGTVNPDFLARVVGEVIASLQQTKQVTPLQTEADPSGMKLIRRDRLSFSGAATGSPRDKLQVAEQVGERESKQLSVRYMKLEDTSVPHDTVSDEMVHIVEGRLDCTVNGKNYRGTAGDSFFIPAKQQTVLSTTGTATCLVVASAVR